MSQLTVTGAVVRYPGASRHDPGTVAVAGVDLDVPTGRRLSLLGPSGCGKSSLLRAVAGLEPLQAGTIEIGGQDQRGVPTHRRGVGMMFQQHALFPHLDVVGNVAFGLRMARVPRAERGRRAMDMLGLVGLSERATAGIGELSGGEQQRVALARTLAPEPRVVLLDEPLASLDRVLREDLLDTMASAFDATETTVVFVTHDQSEAMAIGHRVAVMREGRIVQQGTGPQVWQAPTDPWVAGFLGMNNIVAADASFLGSAAGRGSGQVLLRPDRISLRIGIGDPHDPEAVPGVVESVSFRGGHSIVTCRLAGQASPGADRLEVWTAAAPEVGDRVSLGLASAVVTFPEG